MRFVFAGPSFLLRCLPACWSTQGRRHLDIQKPSLTTRPVPLLLLLPLPLLQLLSPPLLSRLLISSILHLPASLRQILAPSVLAEWEGCICSASCRTTLPTVEAANTPSRKPRTKTSKASSSRTRSSESHGTLDKNAYDSHGSRTGTRGTPSSEFFGRSLWLLLSMAAAQSGFCAGRLG